ncbi:hypothetical protein Ndes2526B_g07715 [Nannochloris sp. 'desiccata']
MVDTAGPFLRYGNCLPGSSTWTGSVLYLTRAASSPANISAATSPLPTETAASSFHHELPPPVLIIHDPGPAHPSFTEQAQHPSSTSTPSPSSVLPAKTGSNPTDASPDPLSNGNTKSSYYPMSLKEFQRLEKSEFNEHRVAGELLDTVNGWSFWRFDMELKLDSQQRMVKYSIGVSGGPSASVTGEKGTSTNFKVEEINDDEQCFGFWLPARGEPYHWGYCSCNGFSSDVPEDSIFRKDPAYLWKDVLQIHSSFPMHVMVGGGDQVYSDLVFEESAILKEWAKMDERDDKINRPWTSDLQSQTTSFYLKNYIASYTQPHVSAAYASIPQVMVWDDHDIFDGFGSYDVVLQECPIFQGLFEVARRFYLLFQQHTTQQRESKKHEFIQQADGYHSVRFMGPQVAVLAIDMRTRRTKKEILPLSTYQLIRNAALELPDCVEHVVVLSGVPVIFPTIPYSEAILEGFKTLLLNSACFRMCGRATGLMDKFGKPELLDDLLDGWVARVHKNEREMFVKLLQEIALVKHVRVTILSGDAHVGGVGRFYSHSPKVDPHNDPIYMVQIISSAIMNGPPPTQAVKMMLRTNFAKNIDERTRQKLVRVFWPRHPRTDKLLPRRNWCDITMNRPPYTRPMNPRDPDFSGLRFSLRVEDSEKWLGYAEEVYDVMVPRAPSIESLGRDGGGGRLRRFVEEHVKKHMAAPPRSGAQVV